MTNPDPERESARVRMREQIAENIRRELAAAKIPHTSLPSMLGLHRDVAARRYSGEVAYFGYEVAMLAVVLNLPAGSLLNCSPPPVAAVPDLRQAAPNVGL